MAGLNQDLKLQFPCMSSSSYSHFNSFLQALAYGFSTVLYSGIRVLLAHLSHRDLSSDCPILSGKSLLDFCNILSYVILCAVIVPL